jgi:hypothetical protein
MNLQKFVTDVIEALGGIVIPQEYALCQVMVPESFRDLFQGRTELELAFDFEVAEENPQAEFVTFGSYLFEQMIALVQRQAIGTIRFADIDTPVLSGALDKIRRFLDKENGVFSLCSERTVTGVWAAFAFRVAYVSDEKEEEFSQVWVDLNRGEVCEDMMRQHHLVPYVDRPVHFSPITCPMDVASALKVAYGHVKRRAETGRRQRVRQEELNREIRRITDYYEELVRETIKRSERKGLSEQKKQELHDKAQSIGLEQQKQLLEIKDKYSVRTEVGLDHGIMVLVPLLEYVVSIRHRHAQKEVTLHYNPVMKRFFMIQPTRHEEVQHA